MQCQWFSLFVATRSMVRAIGCVVILGAPAAALGQEPFRPGQPVKPLPVVQQDPLLDAASAAPGWYGSGHVIRDSVLGPANRPFWTPLHCSNLGDGWTDAWIRPPDGPSGAPRQGLLNTFDGFFTRESHLFYFWTDNQSTGGDKHVGLFQFQTPLSRRLWVGIDAPLESLQSGGRSNTTRFGDLAITPRVMLTETEDLSLSAGLTVRTPTGTTATDADRSTLTPFVATWKDVGAGVQLRGALGLEVPTNRTARDALPGSTLIVNAAAGRTLTPHGATPFGDFTYYVSANLRRDLGSDLGSDNERTFLSITPGIRTHLNRNLFFLAAYEFTVVGRPLFDQRFLVGFVKGF